MHKYLLAAALGLVLLIGGIVSSGKPDPDRRL